MNVLQLFHATAIGFSNIKTSWSDKELQNKRISIPTITQTAVCAVHLQRKSGVAKTTQYMSKHTPSPHRTITTLRTAIYFNCGRWVEQSIIELVKQISIGVESRKFSRLVSPSFVRMCLKAIDS